MGEEVVEDLTELGEPEVARERGKAQRPRIPLNREDGGRNSKERDRKQEQECDQTIDRPKQEYDLDHALGRVSDVLEHEIDGTESVSDAGQGSRPLDSRANAPPKLVQRD